MRRCTHGRATAAPYRAARTVGYSRRRHTTRAFRRPFGSPWAAAPCPVSSPLLGVGFSFAVSVVRRVGRRTVRNQKAVSFARQIVGGNWIELPAGSYRRAEPDAQLSHAQIEVHTHYTTLVSHEPEGAQSDTVDSTAMLVAASQRRCAAPHRTAPQGTGRSSRRSGSSRSTSSAPGGRGTSPSRSTTPSSRSQT